eukprot:GHVN01101269.1.p1 GENE.GHVN01101269.1~~GHVN01101269.1.p1  ORF type:complete len:751 (-),score=111.64 GHVN01101269.1:22-2274(-)
MNLFPFLLITGACLGRKIYLGIDFGSNTVKIATMHSGMRRIDAFLDDQAQRETSTFLAFDNDLPVFGFKATTLFGKRPFDVYPRLLSLLGKNFDSEDVLKYRRDFPAAKLQADTAGTVCIEGSDGALISLEEMLGYAFSTIKKNVENQIDGRVEAVTIAVRKELSPDTRGRLLSVARLGGFSAAKLINTGLAAGLSYAFDLKDTKEKVLIYDTGDSYSEASVVSCSAADGAGIEVSSLGTAPGHFGGADVTRTIKEIVLERFFQKNGSREITPKKMNQLIAEIERMKKCLSLGHPLAVHVEDFVEDINLDEVLEGTVVQERLSWMCQKSGELIEKALENSRLQINDITNVFLIGGNSRILFLRKEIEKRVGAERMTKKINDKEAAVFGATIFSLLDGKVPMGKKVNIREELGHEICAVYDGTRNGVYKPEDDQLMVREVFFPKTEEFSFDVYFPCNEQKLFDCMIRGYEDIPHRVIKTAVFFGSSNGVPAVMGAEAVVEVPTEEGKTTDAKHEKKISRVALTYNVSSIFGLSKASFDGILIRLNETLERERQARLIGEERNDLQSRLFELELFINEDGRVFTNEQEKSELHGLFEEAKTHLEKDGWSEEAKGVSERIKGIEVSIKTRIAEFGSLASSFDKFSIGIQKTKTALAGLTAKGEASRERIQNMVQRLETEAGEMEKARKAVIEQKKSEEPFIKTQEIKRMLQEIRREYASIVLLIQKEGEIMETTEPKTEEKTQETSKSEKEEL